MPTPPNVVRKVKVDGVWKFLPVWKQHGKLDWTKLDKSGVQMVSTEGTFYLDYRENGQRVRRAVGTHARDAKNALLAQSSILNLRVSGIEVDDAPQIQAYRPIAGPRLSEVVAEYTKRPPVKLRKRSRAKYVEAIASFGKWTTKTHLSQLDRTDMNGFMAHLEDDEDLQPATAKCKARIVCSVMNELGADIRMKRGDWPRVTQRQREVYKPEVLQALFAAADVEEFALFQTFLQSGFRDQEVGFLSWDDFHPAANKLSVTKKLALGFDPKNYHERSVPIHDDLVAILLQHRQTQAPGEYLIFPTSRSNATQGRPGGQRDKHMLETLKRLAFRASLNCGRCETTLKDLHVTCVDHPVCRRFGLHMFRHTYATTLLRDGFDIISIQKLLGHADLESTMKYLRALDTEDLLGKIQNSSISKRFLAKTA